MVEAVYKSGSLVMTFDLYYSCSNDPGFHRAEVFVEEQEFRHEPGIHLGSMDGM